MSYKLIFIKTKFENSVVYTDDDGSLKRLEVEPEELEQLKLYLVTKYAKYDEKGMAR